MGFFQKLFGRAPEPKATPTDPRLAELLATPPRLMSEAPEFPTGSIVIRQHAAAQIGAALERAGFVVGDAGRWTRGATTITSTTEPNGLVLLAFDGDDAREAKRAILPTIPWIDPGTLYGELANRAIAPSDLSYLLWATRHYRCAGGVPGEFRMHADAGVKETIRLIDRDQMAEAARAQRRKR